MQSRRIDEMVWQALIDRRFREGLLNGHRRELVAGLDLTDLERTAVMTVQADSLEAFAEALDHYDLPTADPAVMAPMPSGLAGGRRCHGRSVGQGTS